MLEKRKVLRLTGDKTLTEFEEEEKRDEDKEKEQNRSLAMMSLATELGFSIALPLVGGALIGRFLDNQFQTSPRMTLSLIFFGLFISFINIYNLIKQTNKD